MIIIIPGAAGRIGFTLSKYLFDKGHKLILGEISNKNISFLKKNFKNSEQVLYFKSDLTKQKNIINFINWGIKKFGKIDCAVNCLYPKSKNWSQDIGKINQINLDKFLSINLGSTIIFSQEILKIFVKFKSGNLINISSIQGVQSPKFDHYKNLNMTSPVQYSVTKSAIISLTKYLAKYYGKKKIRVNSISPGGILDNQPKVFKNRYKKSCLTKGLLDPIDLCATIDLLISNKSQYLNGQNIIIDDGWSL